jgi:transposase
MKLYGGIDLHSNNSVIHLIDENGVSHFRKRVVNDLENIVALLTPYRDNLVGLVVESTYSWYWLVDGLMDAGFTVHLANTAAIQQYSGLKHGDDDSDADWLANMLRLSILPTGYIYPKDQRMVRDLLRKRMQLVQQKTQNMLSIQGLYDRHLNRRINSNNLKQLTPAQLEKNFTKTKVIVARKTVAHKLARACFYMLKNKLSLMLTKHLVASNEDEIIIEFRINE